jgi:RNA polymerase sigma-70 factor (ECF subfamily)
MTVNSAQEGSDDIAPREAELLLRVRQGDASAFEELLDMHRDRLIRMAEARMSPQLLRRVDAADVVQEALISATGRLDDFLARQDVPFFVWLRWSVRDRLIDLHRQHLKSQKRDANREVVIASAITDASSMALTGVLIGRLTSPSQAAVREEVRTAIRAGLDTLSDIDREILLLRHFEQLSLEDCAQVLQMSKSGANKRHLNALRALRLAVQPFENP